MGGVWCKGEIKNVQKILVQKPEGKRAIGRRRYRKEDIIKTDLK
jgi:hypothetical protein